MKTLSQYRTENLLLTQPSIWKKIYQLKSGEGIVCTMTYPKFFGSTALIEGFGGTWELSKPSIWRSVIEVKKENNHLPFAKFTPGKWGSGGQFELPNGERIDYVQNAWKSINEIQSQQKIPLVSLKKVSWWKSDLNVIVEHESDQLNRNPWIIMAVFYIMLEQRQHAQAASM